MIEIDEALKCLFDNELFEMAVLRVVKKHSVDCYNEDRSSEICEPVPDLTNLVEQPVGNVIESGAFVMKPSKSLRDAIKGADSIEIEEVTKHSR